MRYLTENDFSTDLEDGDYVDVIMDDADRIITFGHVEEDEIEASARKYLESTGETDLDAWFDGHQHMTHQWAVLDFENDSDRRYKMLKPGDDIDEFAAPITILHF